MKFLLALSLIPTAFFTVGSFAAPAPGEGGDETPPQISMAQLRERKSAYRQKQREMGLFALDAYVNELKLSPCTGGKAAETYSCNNVDMHGFLSHQAMGSTTREGNDVWGWTSPNGRELVAVGQTDGTAFVEVLSDGSLRYLGRLPTATVASIWRDMKVIDGYVYIGAESKSHGLQVFDMRKLLPLTSPKSFSTTKDVTARFTGFGSSHNIVANEATKMIYAVGSKYCNGGLFMVDVSQPATPKKAGCASADGYVHDAQCLIYNGPHAAYKGKELCFGFNEDTLTIYDVTEKPKVKIISRTSYDGAAYTHQGWIANDAQTHLLMDDEQDEQEDTSPKGNSRTSTYIWDITNLTRPINTGIYLSQAKSIDHNLYVRDGKAYMSNYGSGLRIVDVSSVASTPSGNNMKEVGFFDVYPEDDDDPENEFHGSWSVYPFFKSGFIIVNSIERGVFSLRYTRA